MLNLPIDQHWTLFLDRDGVINKRIFGGYILEESAFVFNEGALEALTILNKVFGKIVVVTNQQCIGKKLISIDQLNQIHKLMCTQIATTGGRIDAVYFAPELKNEANSTRKPNAAMALEAKKDFPEIDFSTSVMIGDTDSDIIFGKNLGMKTGLILSEEVVTEQADFRFNSLLDFALCFDLH
jgi:histidinol-phosphate phosphatase family protein